MFSKKNLKNGGFQKDKSMVFVGRDGIINVELAKTMEEKDVEQLVTEIEEIMKKTPGKARILFNLTSTTTHIRSSQFRKELAERIKKIDKNIGFTKVAFFGGNLIIRTIASFIIATAEFKNIKIFLNREEALKWLRKT